MLGLMKEFLQIAAFLLAFGAGLGLIFSIGPY